MRLYGVRVKINEGWQWRMHQERNVRRCVGNSINNPVVKDV